MKEQANHLNQMFRELSLELFLLWILLQLLFASDERAATCLFCGVRWHQQFGLTIVDHCIQFRQTLLKQSFLKSLVTLILLLTVTRTFLLFNIIGCFAGKASNLFAFCQIVFSPKLAKWNFRLANHYLPKKVLFFAK